MSDNEALVASASIILCAFESQLSVETWRRSFRHVASYLAQLVEWGYRASEIEQGVIDRHAVAQAEEASCRECGCTEDEACDGGCSWVEDDLCSACLS
jgi:hypothetical protein